MKTFITLALAAGLLIPTHAIQLHKRTDGPARVVGLPIQRRSIPDPVSRDRIRRSNTVEVSLDNELTLYYANATIGTPAQHFRLHVDTGSSDLWVNTLSSSMCGASGSPCADAGTYDANSSSTYKFISSDFNITYVDGSGSSGDYVSDTITTGGTTLSRLQFGIGYESTSDDGILGIGYKANEVQAGRLGKPAYNNLPAQLVAEDKIQSNAYSLWLNDLSSSTGSILFGGVDTDCYHDPLETLPIEKGQYGTYAEFFITLTEVTLGDTVIAEDQALGVLLDTGSSLTYLPNEMINSIYKAVGASYDQSEGLASVPCSLADDTTTLDLTFSSVTISISMDELIIPYTSGSTSNGSPACLFGLAPVGSGTPVLGDTFLRSAYVVYDLENNEISLAQTKFNATTSSIVEIGTGTSPVPDATVVADPVAATSISGGGEVDNPFIVIGSSGAAERRPSTVFGAIAVVAGMIYAM